MSLPNHPLDRSSFMSLLEITNVTKRFSGLIAVNEVSMNVEEGQIGTLLCRNS